MRVLRRLSSLGRLLAALVALAFVGTAAAMAAERAAIRADRARVEARLAEQAEAFAGAIRAWIEVGRAETAALGERLAEVSTDSDRIRLVNAFLADRPEFGRDVLVVAPGSNRAIGASPGVSRDRGALALCGSDAAVFPVFASVTGRDVTPARAFHAPLANCEPRLALGARAGRDDVVIVMASFHDAASRLAGARDRAVLVADAPPAQELSWDQQRLADIAKRGRTAIYEGERGEEILGARGDVGDGWHVLLEREATAFDDAGYGGDTSLLVGATLVAPLAAVFLILALFDIRRRRAHERAEIAKRAFFATVGHELRTPLTVLKGYSETLASRWDALDDSSRKMLIENLVPQTRRLGAVVEKLLFASNIQADAYVKPKPTAIDVVPRLHKVANDVAPLAPLHQFDVSIENDIPDVHGDSDALDRVLRELLDNAVKYSPSGGTIRVRARKTRRGVEIAVTDEGVGLPVNEKEIFEPLVQGEGVDTRVHDEGGAGVGLYIVRTLVRDMGGTVRAERLKPSGTRFIVTVRAESARRLPAASRS